MNTDITSVARLAEEQVRTVLEAADAALSPQSDHPWWFRCTPTEIELHEDSVTGGTHEERVIAAGGALLNLRLAVQAMGVHADVRLLPNAADSSLLAVVRPEHERIATTWERQLAMAGVRGRSPGETVADPAAALPELRRAAEIEQAWLARLSTAQLGALCVPAAPLVVVIGSLQDGDRALLQAGQAIQRVRLAATTLGLGTTPLDGPLANPVAKAELRALIGGALSPHAVLAVHLR